MSQLIDLQFFLKFIILTCEYYMHENCIIMVMHAIYGMYDASNFSIIFITSILIISFKSIKCYKKLIINNYSCILGGSWFHMPIVGDTG